MPGCYEDLDLADLVVFSGHNAAWTHPVLFRRMEAAKARGQKHVVIDPRRTDTAEGADLHLAIAPQSRTTPPAITNYPVMIAVTCAGG